MAYIVPVFLYSDNNTCRHIDTLWLTLTHIKHCFFLKKTSFIRAFKTSQWIHVWYGFFFPLQSPILKMWPSCAPNSIRKTSFLFYKLSFTFVCLIVVVTVTLWESTNREAVNLGLFCCCDLQYIWGNNKKKTLVLCVVINWFGCSSFFFFWIRKKSYLPKVSTTQNSNEPEVLEGQRTFLLLAGETNRHGEEEHLN